MLSNRHFGPVGPRSPRIGQVRHLLPRSVTEVLVHCWLHPLLFGIDVLAAIFTFRNSTWLLLALTTTLGRQHLPTLYAEGRFATCSSTQITITFRAANATQTGNDPINRVCSLEADFLIEFRFDYFSRVFDFSRFLLTNKLLHV